MGPFILLPNFITNIHTYVGKTCLSETKMVIMLGLVESQMSTLKTSSGEYECPNKRARQSNSWWDSSVWTHWSTSGQLTWWLNHTHLKGCRITTLLDKDPTVIPVWRWVIQKQEKPSDLIYVTVCCMKWQSLAAALTANCAKFQQKKAHIKQKYLNEKKNKKTRRIFKIAWNCLISSHVNYEMWSSDLCPSSLLFMCC